MLGLTGCASLTGIAGTEVACQSFRPITWSIADTDQTIREIKGHNAAGKEICNWEGLE